MQVGDVLTVLRGSVRSHVALELAMLKCDPRKRLSYPGTRRGFLAFVL